MKRDVLWSRSARDDLAGVFRHIATDNPDAAERVVDRLDRSARALGEIPTGRPGRVSGVYEKTVSGLPYVIVYQIVRLGEALEQVAILHVFHTSRDWPKGGWPQG